VQIADAHAHAERQVSVIKMATMLEGCTTEEQSSVVCGQNDSMQRDVYLFTVGSVCRVKRFTAGWQTFR
jgi:hypothetical protein